MSNRIYYKVVRKTKIGLESACTEPFLSKYTTQYKINKWVEPKIKGTLLFVFSSYEDASSFIYYHGLAGICHIYQCKIGRVCKIKPISWADDIHYFWKAYKNKKSTKCFPTMNLSGCVSTRRVKLLKKAKGE